MNNPTQIAAEQAERKALELILARCKETKPTQSAFKDIISWCEQALKPPHASEQNPKCPTCGKHLDDSQLGKILDAVMTEPVNASEQGADTKRLEFWFNRMESQGRPKRYWGTLDEWRKMLDAAIAAEPLPTFGKEWREAKDKCVPIAEAAHASEGRKQ